MASLVLIKSPIQPPPVGEVELSAGPLVIGNGKAPADSPIVLPLGVVSKLHARITFADGTYYVEDLKSRNKTYLNLDRLPPFSPRPLKPYDQIGICDFVFSFRVEDEAIRVGETRDFLAAPAARLKTLLDLHADPASSSDLEPLMALVADSLFSTAPARVPNQGALLDQVAGTLLAVFPRAQRCYVLITDEAGRPVPRAVKDRSGEVGGDYEERFNRASVRRATESLRSLLVAAEGVSGVSARSVMCVPLVTSDNRAAGAIQIETRDRSEAFTGADLDLLTVAASFTSVALDRLRTQAQAQAQAVVRNEIETAWKVQRRILPKHSPAVEGYEFHSHYAPALTVSGDYYDFVPLPEGRLAIILGDVVGKGVPAALLVAKLSSEVRSCLLQRPDPAAAVGLLNDQLIRGALREGEFVTLVVMILDPVAHRLTVVNAGHPSPKLYSNRRRALRDVMTIEETGFALGFEPNAKYSAVTVELAAEDTVTAYTDGVTEACNPAGKLFGSAELDRQLAPPTDHGPHAARPRRVCESLLNSLARHASRRAQSDDIALVSFGRWEVDADTGDTLSGYGLGFEQPPAD